LSIWRRSPIALPAGVYDEIVSEALETRLAELEQTHAIELAEVKKDSDVDEQLVTLVRDAARVAIGSRSDARQKIALARGLLAQLAADGRFRPGETALREQLLRGIRQRIPGVLSPPIAAPRGSLLSSGLITNAHGQSVLSQLASEFASADRIDLLCSFIKLSGLDKFRPLIERHRALERPLRVLTTTYMRATEVKAVELLHRLGAEVRVSYDDSSTRLHAKAWLFHRDSEYSTAYVGSSNLSHAAQTEGLEWNVRIAQADQPDLLGEMRDVFDSYWVDADRFEPFDGTEQSTRRLVRALSEPERASDFFAFELEPKDWQKPILRELVQARALGRDRNLVVAATGTGKTLIAAFDYEQLQHSGAVDSLLFVAHRKEILEQSRRVFRHVLRREHFGELWVDGQRPETGRHVFASIQSLAQAAELSPTHFDHVIVDEVHHAAADSYVDLLDRLRPKQLVGLTATPERADGRLYEEHFPRPYIGNLRVWDAIQQQVLVPFRYFVLDVEGLDLSEARWNGGYIDSDLSQRLIGAQDFWVRAVTRAIAERIARPEDIRALAFCVDKAHARVVAERLTAQKLTARVLTDDTPREERDRAKGDLTSGRVQVLCVVDLFNEGVDIPDVNTLFLFRPTESATVFLQQLGRGLRRTRNKDILTVLDVTGRQHPSFRFDRHLRELLGHSPRELREFLETSHGRLPSGCVVQFDERAQADILERVRRAVPSNLDGIRALLESHRDACWDLATFLHETEVDPLDLYRSNRSWTSLRADVGLAHLPTDEAERDALRNVQKLLHVSDTHRLAAWRRLVALEPPRTTAERRLAAMLFVVLYGKFEAARLDDLLEKWRAHTVLREEIRELLPVLETRADALPRADLLAPEIPLALHGRYLDVELSVAFNAVSRQEGRFRNFYTGVEQVAGGRFDLLLVTLDKGDVKHEHLQYADFPLGETRFQWQSQAGTRADDEDGLRHLHPTERGVTPLLFVRETKKDARGVTSAFRYLGPVEPSSYRGERPITIEWELQSPLLPEWVRRWRNIL
jgi:superfamily II DNA or RNA helicase/HKD family nuclease